MNFFCHRGVILYGKRIRFEKERGYRMNHTKQDSYNKTKRNRMELYFRLRQGVHQLVCRPYNNLVIVLLLFLFLILWENRNKVLSLIAIPELLCPVYSFSLSAIAIIIPLILLLGFLKLLGDRASIYYEACLVMAFSAKELRNGHPILISCKKARSADIKILEFYSQIPLQVWLDKKEGIADLMDIHFVEPGIEYGGKRGNHGNRVRLYTAPGRKRLERGLLYDNEL